MFFKVSLIIAAFAIFGTKADFFGCPDFPDIDGAYACSWSWWSDGADKMTISLTYCCNDGSTPVGSSALTCESGGGWSQAQFQCAAPPEQPPAVSCPPPPAVAGANVCGTSSSWSSSGTSTTTTNYATYCCNDNAPVNGDPNISCVNGAGWSTPQLTCQAAAAVDNQVNAACGASPVPFGPFSSPSQSPRCNGATVNGPPTLCLPDKCNDLYPVSIGEVVDRHNCWRSNANLNPKAAHQMQNLTWDDQLAKVAESWACQCPNGHDLPESRTLPDRDTNGVSWDWVGQNICYSSDKMSWSKCVDLWSLEQNDFKYGEGAKTPGAKVGHYTQVVADRSWSVGCGWSYCPNKDDGLTYVQVCNYGPGGNMNDGSLKPYQI